MRRIMVLGVVMLWAGTAQAGTLAPATDAYWEWSFAVLANDGVNNLGENYLEQRFTQVPPSSVTSDVSVTGTVGILRPMLTLGGEVTVAIPGSTAATATLGTFSHRPLVLTFTTVTLHGAADPLALAPVSARSAYDVEDGSFPSTLRVAGTWGFGDEDVPFDTTVDTWTRTSGDNFEGPSFVLYTPSPDLILATVSDGGVTYTGRLRLEMGAFVPEPGSGTLLALGLLVLALQRHARRHV